jgi:hypothetical protein
MENDQVGPEVIHEEGRPRGDGFEPPKRNTRKSGKAKGWRYLRTAEDVKAAANAIYNMVVVGDTRAVKDGEPPPKMDPQSAHAALSALRCWMEAHSITIEKRLEEMSKTLGMMVEVLEARGIDVSGGGSRSH